MKKKIVLFMPSLRGGGAERAMLLFAEGLLLLGYQPTLLLAQKSGPLLSAVPKELPIVDLQASRSIFALFPLLRYLRRHKPDALFSTMVHANIIALIANMLAGGKAQVVVREANVPLSEKKRTLSRKVVFWLTPLLYRKAAAIIAVSEGVAAELQQMEPRLGESLHVLPNPVVSKAILSQANEPVQHPWFSEKTAPVVLAVARLQPHKGFDVLLHAFAEVRKHSDARLVILGEGPERSFLEQLSEALEIDDVVSLPGWVENPFSFIKQADVFVLSSRHEGMPNVLLQALALATPVVATDCPSGPKEILGACNTGELIPMDDSQIMAQAILKTLNTQANPKAAPYVQQRYGIEHAAEQYLATLDWQESPVRVAA